MAGQTAATPSLELVLWLCAYQAWTWGHPLAAARGLPGSGPAGLGEIAGT